MGQITSPSPVLLVVAISSRYNEALDWACRRLKLEYGSIALTSDAFQFTETDYYQSTMGDDLKKMFGAFERPIDPGEIAAIKLVFSPRLFETRPTARSPLGAQP